MTFSRSKPWTLPAPLVAKAWTRSLDPRGPARSAQHLAKVRRMACLVCVAGSQTTPTEAHHVRCIGPRTMGRRVSDMLVVPVCRWHHTIAPSALHAGDESAFWLASGIDPRDFIRSTPEGAEALKTIEVRAA